MVEFEHHQGVGVGENAFCPAPLSQARGSCPHETRVPGFNQLRLVSRQYRLPARFDTIPSRP